MLLGPVRSRLRSLVSSAGAPTLLFFGLLGSLALTTRPARAGDFDAQGRFTPDPDAVYTESFETAPPQAEGQPDATVVEDPTALLGTSVLEIPAYGQSAAYVKFPDGQGSYRARAWVKGEGLISVSIEYLDRSPYTFAQLYPTGRVTSDDWVELESEPFSVDSEHGPQAGVGGFSPEGMLVDAVEIVRDGEFRDNRVCKGDNDRDSCRADEICFWRTCRDTRGFFPPVPADAAARDELARYMASRVRYFFGPWRNRREYLPEAELELAKMRATSQNTRFWQAYSTAIRKLHDSHSAATPSFVYVGSQNPAPGRKSLNACFIVGDADLSTDKFPKDPEYPDVLIGHTGTKSTWGLRAGDRLVAIDGLHPIRWAKAHIDSSWSLSIPDDPASVSQIVETMRGDISRLAETVSVVRCGANGACGPVEVLTVAGQVDEDPDTDWVVCDHRPLGHVQNYPASHQVYDSVFASLVDDSKEGERIYGMTWDSLLGGQGGVTSKISKAVTSWKTEKARGVILDHRTGNGGTADAPAPILAFTTPQTAITALAWRSRVDEAGPKTLEEGLALAGELGKGQSSVDTVGSKNPTTSVPVALLITRDVSQSDFFPHQIKGSPNARIFGPHPTNGAFSSLNGLSYWLGLSFQFGSGDTVDVRTGEALCGSGAKPDEVVLPKQSDLVVGKDTVYEAAAAWVRANLAPDTVTP
jgi:hypothetical protein